MKLTDQQVIDIINELLDHWEGKLTCGKPLPCRTHGGQ